MNLVVSAVIGGVLATAAVFGGVHAASGGDQRNVDSTTLFSYSSR
ncbi:hypothetical protein [Nocardioides sp. TRM66260-LWL]|nr:hypothetical protein [Nocardioides sp. TRM66260-LWL]